MSHLDIEKLSETAKAQLIEARWTSSSEVADIILQTYKANTAVYENRAGWLQFIPERRSKFRVQANRIFVDMEAVINSLIANPPGINILPSRDGNVAQEFARKLESFFRKKYSDLNIKETMRMGLRNLYFGRLIVIKPFWNPVINDFDFRSIDPRNIRVGKYSRKEVDSEFCIEEIEDNLCAVIDRFPEKKDELMKKYGITDEEQLYIKNPDVKYKEAWIGDYVIFKIENIILDTIKNPYWDWEGVLVTDDEEKQLSNEVNGTPGLEGPQRRDLLQKIKLEQPQRSAELQTPTDSIAQPTPAPDQNDPQDPNAPADPNQQPVEPTPPKYKPYMFNYFDNPRKPFIYTTIFNNENTPIGRTDMITLAAELQRGVDKRKMDIDENCELANGVLKVDASVMGKSDAQRIRFETKGIIWGKGVKDGVTREVGQPLPEMVFQDMQDSRSEIDNIMAASSAFRGEREGQETKAGRLALVQQSFQRLNELTQVVDYVSGEIFSWGMQLAKTRYTEYHYAKWMGKEGAREIIELIQDDFENGSEVTIIPGKTMPVDDESKFEQAQNDVEKGYISPPDYLEIAKYDNAKELSQNAVAYKLNPVIAVGMPPEQAQQLQPPPAGDIPKLSISYNDLPPDGQVQLAKLAGITIDPKIVIAEKMAFMANEQAKTHSNLESENVKNQTLKTKSAIDVHQALQPEPQTTQPQ